MKIELSQNKKIHPSEQCLTVWQEAGPDIDLTMDLKKLTFAPGSVDVIYALHVLDHLFPQECLEAVANWRNCLKPGGKLFVSVDDFEILCRLFLTGEMTIEEMNSRYSHPTQFTKDYVISLLSVAGFSLDQIVAWYISPPLSLESQDFLLVKEDNDILMVATKL